ncbi:MAG: zf-TFIIB domain-containing protein [Acidobacteria bacterium]|nr:zf-TFIIB domain-containing protein [Acidobacteriota bacterium]MCW5948837.1 zf-TFIIB domain-containing protein [Pyrinomonadaceae bacterium]
MPIDLEDRGQALENEYFRRQEQELIAKMKAKLEEDTARSLAIKCPKCEGTLIETDFENIKIDVCDQCSGVWLDAGEMAQIVDKEKTDDSGWFGKLFG